MVGYVLHKRCSLEGEQCSYAPIGQIQDLDPPQMPVFCLTPRPKPEEDPNNLDAIPSLGPGADNLRRTSSGSRIDEAGENEERQVDRTKRSCVAFLRAKKGDWHGGRAEERAAVLHDCMVVSVGQWLELWKTSQAGSRLVAAVLNPIDGRIHPSQEHGLEASVSRLEDAYTRAMRRPTYFVGNTVTWCCTPCYPAPSERFTALAFRIAEELESDLNSRHRHIDPVSKRDSHPPSNTTAPLELGIHELAESCKEARVAHREAICFISQYGTLFRKYDGAHRYTELLCYGHTILFALAVGLLKHDTKEQALAVFVLWFGLLCYYVVASPFNEYLRNRLEVCSVSCFVSALGLIVLHAFDVLEDVGDAVNYLCIGSVGFKILYQNSVLLRTWLRKRPTQSDTPGSVNHDEAVALEIDATSTGAASMPAGQEWDVFEEPSFLIYGAGRDEDADANENERESDPDASPNENALDSDVDTSPHTLSLELPPGIVLRDHDQGQRIVADAQL